MNTIYAFILTFLAGISTILGVLPIFINISNKTVINIFKLSFITLLIISLLELIPDSYILINRHFNNLFTIIIILLSYFLGKHLTLFIDSKVEEGSKLYKVGIISMIAMILHNIPEGIITYITTTNDFKLGFLIAISIMLHNIPEGLLIAVPIYKSTKKRGYALFLTIISGMSEFLGALLSYLFLYKYIDDLGLGIIYSITAGIMITISLYELAPIIKNKAF